MVTVSPWSSSSDSSSSSSDSDSFTRRSLEIEASWNRHIRRKNLMMQMGLMMMLAYLIEREGEEEEEEEEEEERAHALEMRELRSRKRNHSSFPNYYEKNNKKKTPIEISNSSEPFPSHLRPTPEECRLVRDSLLSLHGFPKEFTKYRKVRSGLGISSNTFSEPNENEAEVVEEAQKESVWDGLVNTLLSQNTTEANSTRAFASLKAAFPTWEDVLAAESKYIEDAIRCGGLAVTKASCIKNLLAGLLEKKGKLCLEYLRDMSIDEIKAELSGFKGIGPKTATARSVYHTVEVDGPVPPPSRPTGRETAKEKRKLARQSSSSGAEVSSSRAEYIAQLTKINVTTRKKLALKKLNWELKMKMYQQMEDEKARLTEERRIEREFNIMMIDTSKIYDPLCKQYFEEMQKAIFDRRHKQINDFSPVWTASPNDPNGSSSQNDFTSTPFARTSFQQAIPSMPTGFAPFGYRPSALDDFRPSGGVFGPSGSYGPSGGY